MQMAKCPTMAQCRGVVLPPVRPLQAIMLSGNFSAPAARQALVLAACSNSLMKLRAGYTAGDSSNAASLAIGGGRSTRERIERVTSCRAAVQESSLSALVELAPTENGSSLLSDRASAETHVLDQFSSDFIGFGCLLENDTFFRERFVIRFSEVGHRGTISLETLSSLLQEAATNHVIAMDFAFSPGKNLDGNITVVTRMHIEVDRYPAWRDLVEVDTWFQREGKNAVRRDWVVKDVKTGEKIAFGTSTWVLMNVNTRRLSKLTDEHWAALEPHMKQPPRLALSEEQGEVSTLKIAKLGDDASFKSSGLIASDKDTDMNQHVNNIRYMGWMLESIPEEVKNAYEVSKITLEYRQEASRGELVDSVAETEESGNGMARQFIHLIKTSGVGKEINRGRTVWRPLE